jgi:hypothetical protein
MDVQEEIVFDVEKDDRHLARAAQALSEWQASWIPLPT